jgi:ArsR family transcriptional regulator, arsenate/arsenite/antimonite-responsive transcriptional repressor
MKNLEKILKAFANRRRLQILRLLKEKNEASVGAIAEKIELSFKATSKHLAVLFSAGIVEREQRGLQMFYSIAKDKEKTIAALLNLL